MNEFVDLYCERRGTGFWAEPFNAVTNLSFLVAAFFAWRNADRHRRLTREIGILIFLAVSVGVGSFLFHTFATGWAMYMDVIPILLFQMAFIWIYARRQMGSTRLFGGLLLAGLLLTSLPLMPLRHLMNGSLAYLPAWLLLAGFGAFHIRRNKNRPWQLMIAAILLFLALIFRTVDLEVCGTIPLGTHFLWHLINGFVFYLVMQSLIVNPGKNSEEHAP
jgi:hypothetical protein